MPAQSTRRFLNTIVMLVVALLGSFLVGLPESIARTDRIVLKDGQILEGIYDRENSIAYIYDGIRRVVIRQTRIDRVEEDPRGNVRDLESFKLIQPLEVHGGRMPTHAIRINAGPWDEYGQRLFEYSTLRRDRTLRRHQLKLAINEIGPETVKYRGIDGFWKGQIRTNQVPRKVILDLLSQIDQSDQGERLRVGRFLIQAGWYDEAVAELEQLGRDFPELGATIESTKNVVIDLRARDLLEEAEIRIQAQQPRTVTTLLTQGRSGSLSPEVDGEFNQLLERLQAQEEEGNALAMEVRQVIDQLSAADREQCANLSFEIVQALSDVPDASIPRLQGFREGPTDLSTEARAALVISSWLLGPNGATTSLEQAIRLIEARTEVAAYLQSSDRTDRAPILDALEVLTSPKPEAPDQPSSIGPLEISGLIRQLSPPRAGTDPPTPGAPTRLRVLDDPNPRPTEYSVLLPPEYHPLRTYPAVVALHGGQGPEDALDWWGPESSRRGYIVIAPDYLTTSGGSDYRYTPDEHAAVLLALRDARKRFAIDPDRVFIGGTMIGGQAAWDIGLAHFDVFAGIATISGLPAKYVWKTMSHAEFIPIYVATGDLAAGSTETFLFEPLKQLIRRNWDVTYVEYFVRGLEALPEEAPDLFDWMDRRRRTPHRDEFEVVACRPSDNRFYGIVLREIAQGQTTDPASADPLGKGLKSATVESDVSQLANQLRLSVSGVNAVDIWLAPEFFDFEKRLKIVVNGRRHVNAVIKPNLESMLEDVRIRGDRSQLYWAKVSLGGR